MQKNSFLLLGLIIGLYSCSLESDEPQATENNFQNLFNLAYNNTRTYIDAYYNLSEACTDEMIPLSAENSLANNEYWKDLHQHTWTPDQPLFQTIWTQAYNGINLCNLALQESDENNLNFIAELKALRAFYYYLLLDCFGGIPIIIEDIAGHSLPERSGKVTTFNFIKQELLTAIPDLTESPIYGRINKDVAYAILAKLYLNAPIYTGEATWEKCVEACKAIEESGNYNLLPDYFDNFTPDNHVTGASEILFFAIYDVTAIPSGIQMDMASRSIHPVQIGLSKTLPNPFLAVPPDFYNQFHPSDDVRTNAFLIGPQFSGFDASDGTVLQDSRGNDLDFSLEIPDFPFVSESTGARVLKYQIDPARNGEFANNDFAIFRYADVLLMHAEALIHLGEFQEAIALINQVRTRAFQGSAEDIDLSSSFQQSILLEFILKERGFELFWEGFRRQDLIRHNQFCEPWLFKPTDDDCEKRKLFPIPQQIIIDNPLVTQNPGY